MQNDFSKSNRYFEWQAEDINDDVSKLIKIIRSDGAILQGGEFLYRNKWRLQR